MEFTTFVRKPFQVEAIEITNDNITDIAELIGKLNYKEDGTPFIKVNRWKMQGLDRVYLGFWMTKMGDEENIRCYSRRIFTEQFTESDPSIAGWVEYLNKDIEEAPVDELSLDDSELVDVNDPGDSYDKG